jgi:hypothetical protein
MLGFEGAVDELIAHVVRTTASIDAARTTASIDAAIVAAPAS